MLSLTKEPERGIEYGGKVHPVDFSFDNVIRYYEMIDDNDLDNAQKVYGAWQIFLGTTPPDDVETVVEVIRTITDYLKETPYGNAFQVPGVEENTSNPIRYYSFKQDAGAIYASFKAYYGIDLVDEMGRMHWDKFTVLLDGLGPDTQFKRIIEIRQKSIAGLEGEELQNLTEAKQYYQLTDSASLKAQTEQADKALDAMFASFK